MATTDTNGYANAKVRDVAASGLIPQPAAATAHFALAVLAHDEFKEKNHNKSSSSFSPSVVFCVKVPVFESSLRKLARARALMMRKYSTDSELSTPGGAFVKSIIS